MRFILIFYLMLINLIGQENSNNDLLIIDRGPRYLGKYIGEEGGKIKFQPNGNSSYIPRKVKEIKVLNVNGTLVIQDGEWIDDSFEEIRKNTAYSEEHFKERSISKLKTTNENYGRGSIVKANDYQIRFIAKPKLFHRGGAHLIDIESIEEITLVPENYGKLLKIISNLSIPGTYCFTLLVNIWSDTAHIEALIMTMIPVAVKGLLKFTQDKKNTIKMSNWDEAVKIVYFEDLLSKQ